MTVDPFEVMELVVAQEASRIQTLSDHEVLIDAQAVAEAEQQRSRIGDRLEAARGLRITCHLPDAVWHGVLREVGPEVIVVESDSGTVVIALTSVLRFVGLPQSLRCELEDSYRLGITWSSMLREWAAVGPVQFTLLDGQCVGASIDAVGTDFVDIRCADGLTTSLVLAGIRCAIRSR